MPDKLSSGETKRVTLARCIITKPKILLLDEPTSNLDFAVKIEVRELIKKIHKKYKEKNAEKYFEPFIKELNFLKKKL